MLENPKLDLNHNVLDGIKSPAIDVTESSPNFVGQPKFDKDSNSSEQAATAVDELAKKIAEMKLVKTRQLLLNYDYFMSPDWDGRHGIYCSCSSDEDYDESDSDESNSEDSDNDYDDDDTLDDFHTNDENKNDSVQSESDENTDNGEDPTQIWFRSGRSRSGRNRPRIHNDSKSHSGNKKYSKKLNGHKKSRKCKYHFKKSVIGNTLKEFDMINASTRTKRYHKNDYDYNNLKIRIATNRIVARRKHGIKKHLHINHKPE